MSEDLHHKILVEALREVPFTGFSDATLRAAAENIGAAPSEVVALFPEGPVSLVTAFSHWADAEMATRMATGAPSRVRERVAASVRFRLEVIAPHKEAARRAAAFLALPVHAPLATTLLFETVDAMWRAAGDRSSDFNYYTKRALLAGVYASTLVYWFTDSSENNVDTRDFLDKRINDVMQIQKLRGELENFVDKMPDPLGILASLRAGSSR